LDYSRPFLPSPFSGESRTSVLNKAEGLKLNHITGNSYMNLFAFVEEYIIAQVVGHAHAELFGDHDAIRALLRFSEEELKHRKLFVAYCEAFARDFGSPCRVLEHAATVANVILQNSAAAVLLTTLHLELMTQQHYVDCIKGDKGLDPLFSNLLKHHWLEEAQHAKLDILELSKLAHGMSADQIEAAFDQYLGIVTAFDGLLAQQVELDTESLQIAIGRQLSAQEQAEIGRVQKRSYRRDFIVTGMTNPAFVSTAEQLSPTAAERVRAAATEYAEGGA
jgi:hypothetical protein